MPCGRASCTTSSATAWAPGARPASTTTATPGQEYDITPVNAYNMRARQYYPKLGRFMQNDPIGDKGGSTNWYLYVKNNPVNAIDRTGKIVTLCTDGFHGWLKVNNEAWGFYPRKGLEPLVAACPACFVPAELRPDKGRPCTPLFTSDDPCLEKCVLSNWTGHSMLYSLAFYNCYDWANSILRLCTQ